MPHDSTKTGSTIMPVIPKSAMRTVPPASTRIVLWEITVGTWALSTYRVDVTVHDVSRMQVFETTGSLREL